ncbi:MAG: hypothetical protein Q7T81_17535 [Pseudolabrys sp.]|nr:hypothetical protein [Pseudolabrys sp.]
MSKEDRARLFADIKRTQQKIVSAAEAIVDTIGAAPPAQPHTRIETVRRVTAELIGTWQLCDRSACRRARHCRGEPMHCLRHTAPLFPPGVLAGLVGKRRRPRRSRALPRIRDMIP